MNDNNSQGFYRSPIQMNHWTMRNNYQNLARRSFNKTRHNSISKIIIKINISKRKYTRKRVIFKKSTSSIGYKTLEKLPKRSSSVIIKKYNLQELGKHLLMIIIAISSV